MNPKFHKNSELENMMLDIILLGQKETWNGVELEMNAWKRIEKRKLLTKALKELEKEEI